MRGVGHVILHIVAQQKATHHSAATQKPPQTWHPTFTPPHLQRKQTKLPCLNLMGGQAIPGHQMPKGTCPNNPICCHASVHVGEGWVYVDLRELGGGGSQQSRAPESAVVGTAQAGRGGEGRNGKQQTHVSLWPGQICWSRLQSRAVHRRRWCKGPEGTVDSEPRIAPMHPRRQSSVPCSRAEWTPMSRMDAGHSVSGLPEAQRQHTDLLPLQP